MAASTIPRILVADSVEDAREQWVAVFARDRADLGPAHAATLAAAEAERYARLRPLEDVLDDLRAAWTVEAGAEARLEVALGRRDVLREIVTLTERRDTDMPPLRRALEDTRTAVQTTAATLRRLEPVVTAHADEQAAALTAAWDAQRQPARDAARTIRPAPAGSDTAAPQSATPTRTSNSGQPHGVPTCPPSPPTPHRSRLRRLVRRHPPPPRDAARPRPPDRRTRPPRLPRRPRGRTSRRAGHRPRPGPSLRKAEQHYSIALQHHGSLAYVDNPAERLADAEAAVASEEATLTAARARITALRADPTLRTQPGEVVELAREDWQADRDHAAALRQLRWAAQADRERAAFGPRGADRGAVIEIYHDDPGRGISR